MAKDVSREKSLLFFLIFFFFEDPDKKYNLEGYIICPWLQEIGCGSILVTKLMLLIMENFSLYFRLLLVL